MAALLLTRPLPSARESVPRLEALGWQVLLNPLFAREELLYVVEDKPYQAILLTSGLAAFALRGELAQRAPVFAVGEGTAQAAQAVGAKKVMSAKGDAAALLRLVATSLKPEAGPLLYLAGQERAFDMVGATQALGFTIDLVEVYGMCDTGPLLPETLHALHNGDVAATLLYSPYAARRFRALLDEAGEDVGKQTLVCLSPRVATAAGAGWRAVHVAAAPNEASLFETLNALPEGDIYTMTQSSPEPETPPEAFVESVALVPYQTPAPKSGNGWAVGLSLLALLAAVASPLAYNTLMPATVAPAQDANDKIAVLEAKLADLGRTQSEHATSLTALNATPSTDAASTEMANQVEYLSRKVDELLARPAAPAPDDTLKTELAALSAQVRELQTKLSRQQESAFTQAERVRFLALLQLNSALQGGEAFRAPWTLLQATPESEEPALMAALNEAAPALTPYLNSGVPTLATLKERFPALARTALKDAEPKPEGWLDGALSQTKGLVSIRRQGEVEGDSVEALLARAESRLNANQLSASLDELAKLPPAAQGVMAEWQAQAQARLATEALLLKIQEGSARSAAAPEEESAP